MILKKDIDFSKLKNYEKSTEHENRKGDIFIFIWSDLELVFKDFKEISFDVTNNVMFFINDL